MNKHIEEKAKFIDLYKSFRRELDDMCVPLVIDELRIVHPVIADGEIVGMIGGFADYIDCLYVLPEYRKRGLARKAALEYVDGKLSYGIRLHIINNNEVAKKFWHSIFVLKEIGNNSVDTLYEIVDVRKEKTDEQAG